MNIVRWSPNRPLRSFIQEFDRLFSRAVAARDDEGRGCTLYPAIDLVETEEAFVIKADLPGIKQDEIDLSITDNVLTIKGEKKSEKVEEGESYHFTERTTGTFTRSIPLPTLIDQEKVTAAYRNGVLEVSVPKHEQVKAKKIEIKSE